MKALLLAATSSLALTGFAMAQTTTTTTTETPAGMAADSVAATADKVEDAADKAGNAVDETVTTGTADAAEDAADRAEDTADAAVTEGAATGTVVETTTVETTTTEPATATTTTTAPATATTTTAPVDATVATTDAVVAAPDVNAPVMSADNPGMLGSYIMSRRIYTTNQPSSTAWENTTLTERPADWTDIAKVDNIVIDPQGDVTGYVADIGGFLGLGAKQVLLGKDALHLVRIGDDAFFATNYTKEELQALPDFDNTTVLR